MDFSTGTSGIKNDHRLELARAWLKGQGVQIQSGFQAVAGDASFRRYFRLMADGKSRILMDAPPPGEDVRPFIDVDQRLRSAKLHAPEIFHADMQNGYLLLEDLGDALLRDSLDEVNVGSQFPQLFEILRVMALTVNAVGLPEFDTALLRKEMNLFPDWYLGHHRPAMPRERFDASWNIFCDQIISSALDQPQHFVHRDFHSCNLINTHDHGIGVIDFQDAVKGPLSYDFVSLVWDRYINWPREQIEAWAEEFRLQLGVEIGPGRWRRYCDLMGLQRNLKIVGIFARLYYRDAKTGYLEMIPRFYDYVTSTLRIYPEFEDMLEILEHPECAP